MCDRVERSRVELDRSYAEGKVKRNNELGESRPHALFSLRHMQSRHAPTEEGF